MNARALAAVTLALAAVGCTGGGAQQAPDGGASPTDVACGTGQYRYEDRCVVPCPTDNGSLCEVDGGQPVLLPPSDAGVAVTDADASAACSDGGCGPTLSAVAFGQQHTCVLLAGGAVRCFGAGDAGQLGGASATTAVPGLVARQIVAGTGHTCALLADHTVDCWGANDLGQLGDGTTMARATPAPVSGVSNALALSAAGLTTYALVAGGTVVMWGPRNGDTRFPATTPVAADLAAAVDISAGAANVCSRVEDGTIQCSNNNSGAGGGSSQGHSLALDGGAPLADVQKIACSSGASCVALTSSGQVYAWGQSRNGVAAVGGASCPPSDTTTPHVVGGLASVVDVAAGLSHACAVDRTGSVWCWGMNDVGQLGVGPDAGAGCLPTPTRVAGLAGVTRLFADASGRATCAVLADGSLRCWGANDVGQLGGASLTAPLVIH